MQSEIFLVQKVNAEAVKKRATALDFRGIQWQKRTAKAKARQTILALSAF